MGKIRIPIYGFVHYDEKEEDIMNSFFFLRLRNIKQLSLTSYVYPGATHTRFEHSLGVMEIASKMFDSLLSKPNYKEKIQNSLQGIGIDLNTAKTILRLSALMHDVGHLPFSHSAENSILPKGKKHEDVSVAVIVSQRDTLEKLYSKEIIDAICQIIGNQPIISELKLLRNIISGSIDADRTDYLIRDSYHCGVDYGSFDYNRLIESLTVVDSSTDGLELSIDEDGVHALEALIMARYYMFAQVYFHKTRRIYDYYLRNFMQKWQSEFGKDILNILNEDDVSVWQNLRMEAIDTNSDYYGIARRILKRKNHSVILSSEYSNKIVTRKTDKVHDVIEKNNPELDFWIDSDSVKIHDFYSDGDEDGEELMITKGTKEILLTTYSAIFKKMPKKFAICRLYAAQREDAEKIEKCKLDKLIEQAEELEGSVK